MEKHLFEKWLTAWKSFFFFFFFGGGGGGGGDILLIKIKIKCPAGQNLEMTFIYLKISVFEFFFLNCHIFWCFYLWRVLSVIINPPLYDYSTLSPYIHLSPHSFQENWHDHKKFWRFHQIPPFCSWGDDAMVGV